MSISRDACEGTVTWRPPVAEARIQRVVEPVAEQVDEGTGDDDRREAPNQLARRVSRIAVKPSVPWTCGRQRMNPPASRATGKSAGLSTCHSGCLSRKVPTTPSFSSGSREQVA